jgi:aerobic-type carbon monoxide dehydrogenase small subunit (CoxS/CutS family)
VPDSGRLGAESVAAAVRIRFALNGTPVETDVRTDEPLVAVLRERLGHTSVRATCGIGVCGTCTALLDGELASTCLLLAPLVDGRALVLADGLGAEHPVVRAFAAEHAFQCGYCTPGFVLAVTRLLQQNRRPTDPEITAALAGNLCRCGSYARIRRAVHRAASLASAGGPPGAARLDEDSARCPS